MVNALHIIRRKRQDYSREKVEKYQKMKRAGNMEEAEQWLNNGDLLSFTEGEVFTRDEKPSFMKHHKNVVVYNKKRFLLLKNLG
jgi:hypothetical protein